MKTLAAVLLAAGVVVTATPASACFEYLFGGATAAVADTSYGYRSRYRGYRTARAYRPIAYRSYRARRTCDMFGCW